MMGWAARSRPVGATGVRGARCTGGCGLVPGAPAQDGVKAEQDDGRHHGGGEKSQCLANRGM